MIILIGGEKGGTGKTTIATNLAVIRATETGDVLLVDCDKQGSASAWGNMRNANSSLIKVPTVQKLGDNIGEDLKALHTKYKDIIVDAGGRDSVELRAAMVVADKIYIPVQASQFDIWSLTTLNILIGEVKSLKKGIDDMKKELIVAVVINRGPTNCNLSDDIKEAEYVLSDFRNLPVSKHILKERVAYRRAATKGESIMELDKKDLKAIDEIKNIYNEAFYG